jgi:hypothetical protein
MLAGYFCAWSVHWELQMLLNKCPVLPGALVDLWLSLWRF